MPRPKTLDECYNSCLADGFFRKIESINAEKVRSLVSNSQTNINSAQIIIKAIKQDAKEWMSVYIHYYEALRMLTEAFLIFDRIDIQNHQCLFSYLCTNHSELEFSWDFFEKIRTKRHGVNYYGESISFKDWKAAELQFNLYISALKKEIETKLKEKC